MPTPRALSISALGSAALAACTLPSAKLELPAETPAEPEPEPAKTGEARRPIEREQARSRSGRPQVVAAELREGGHLRLHFSESLAPVGDADPDDFRLSFGMRYAYPAYAYAYYYDVGYELGEYLSDMRSLALGERTDILELYFEPAIPMEYCLEIQAESAAIEAESMGKGEGGLFLHYAAGEHPIKDEQGATMKDVGPGWVLLGKAGGDDAAELYLEGPPARSAMRGLIPIRCGPELPPGPV